MEKTGENVKKSTFSSIFIQFPHMDVTENWNYVHILHAKNGKKSLKKYERLYWLFWISLPTALTKRFRVPLWGPKMKRLLVSYRYQIFFAQTSAETYCSTQRIWQSDQFPPLFFAIEKKFVGFWRPQKATYNRVKGSPSK